MSALQIIFLLLGLVTFLAAVMVVTSPKMIHAGLWLILALAGVAGLLVLLESPFLAVVQVVVYIGAIAILIIFAIMLTRKMMNEDSIQINSLWPGAVIASLILFGALAYLILQTPALDVAAGQLPGESSVLLQDLGRALVDVDRYILPFEVASVLLLAGMIGAIYIAQPSMDLDEEADEG
ncbi:MAG: NADH-quinone oxidoreductase subunit J [Anaerolineales bacterium]